MIRRAMASLLVVMVAWGFRRHVTVDRMREALARSFGHRDYDWREDVILDALARNRGKLMRKINA